MKKQWKLWETLFTFAPKSLRIVTAAMILEDACSCKKSNDKPRQHIKKQRHYFAYKCLSSQSYGFSSSHVLIWELYNEGWAPMNWVSQTVVLEKTLESPLDSKEIKPVNLKGNQYSVGRTEYSLEGLMLKLELQHFGRLMQRANSLEKTLILGKIEGRRRRGQQRMR